MKPKKLKTLLLCKAPSVTEGAFFTDTRVVKAYHFSDLPLMKTVLSFIFLASTTLSSLAASLSVNEIFVRLQATIEDEGGTEALIADLEDLDNRELRALLKDFDLTWKKLRTRYFPEYQEFVKTSFTGEARREAKQQIQQHRDDFRAVYQLGEGAMKPLLKSKSMPALKALRKLILPSGPEIFETAPDALQNQRKIILVLAKFRDAIVKIAVLQGPGKALSDLLAEEKEVIASFSGLPRDGLRVIEENDEIAEKNKIPDAERRGIRELNEWRLLLGLNALLIDPRLCEASRGHSADMNNHNFFAHQSPLPGRTTPWDRAANAGTRSSGENIYMGSPDPASANRGWFYSPGHHKNMFKATHRFIGLGRYQSHWTQMFG